MRLFLVRHPAPSIAKDICYGSSDIAVAADELASLALRLKDELPANTPLFSSPLQRCAQLATMLKTALSAPSLTLDMRLQEMDFGSWELQPWSHIARSDIDAWAADTVAYRPGGGESVLSLAVRINDFYTELAGAQQDAIIVCHAGTIRLLSQCGLGMSAYQMASAATNSPHAIAYGAVTTLDRC